MLFKQFKTVNVYKLVFATYIKHSRQSINWECIILLQKRFFSSKKAESGITLKKKRERDIATEKKQPKTKQQQQKHGINQGRTQDY